jgi:hypothetical protein
MTGTTGFLCLLVVKIAVSVCKLTLDDYPHIIAFESTWDFLLGKASSQNA